MVILSAFYPKNTTLASGQYILSNSVQYFSSPLGTLSSDQYFQLWWAFIVFVTNGVAMKALDMIRPGNCIIHIIDARLFRGVPKM